VPSLTAEAELALCERAKSTTASERTRAFAEIFGALRSQVFALCLHVTGSPSDAEDAVQECFMAVHAGLGGFRGDARLSTWVYRVAVRSALAVKARRRPVHRPLEDAADAPSSETSPEDLAHARREAARLLAALGRLSEEHRIVLALFAIEGMGHAAIAEILGVPPGTVWSRLHLARKRLGALLASGPG
jgi:RNA polymerase sigma-70 factor, ECF subfamily